VPPRSLDLLHQRRVHDQVPGRRSLFGAFCPGEGDVEARCMLAFSLFTGSHFIAADHGSRSRADVLQLALMRLEAG
jgi:hypothetical protein